MTSEMGCGLAVLCLLLATIVEAIEVNVTGKWRTELGWEVTCLWETLPNDTLQSVRLYNNGQQFMIYRPEKHGLARSEVFRTPDSVMNIDCTIATNKGTRGQCVLVLEPYQPPVSDFTYTCEVSGERPMFRIGKQEYLVKVLVPPSDAELVATVHEGASQTRVILNCSSSGLPAPTLQWTIGNEKQQADFTGRVWNATSKLWHVWSYFSYTRSDETAKLLCTPEVNSYSETVTGRPAEFNSAPKLLSTASKLCAILLLSSFLR